MNTISRFLISCFLAVTGVFTLPCHAEDIDLYVAGETQLGSAPNVLIIIDNTANYASAQQGLTDTDGVAIKNGQAEWGALKTVLDGLAQSSANVNVGIMMGTESGSAQGGYVRFAIRGLTVANVPNIIRQVADSAITNINDPAEKISSNGAVYDNYLNDAVRYFNGLTKFGPHDRSRDYAGNNNYLGNGTLHPAATLAGNAFSDAADLIYNQPADATAGCGRNFIILIGNSWPSPGDSSADFSTKATAVASALGRTLSGADLQQFPLVRVTGAAPGTSVSPNHWADEWAWLLNNRLGVQAKRSDTGAAIPNVFNNITTYTIDVYKDHQDHDQTALLSAVANKGGGKYFAATSEDEIRNAMTIIFAEIQAINSVFTSATLPVSVNLQGIYENQVFFGVFRPDAQSRPRWYGNLKQYRFGLSTDANGATSLYLADSRSSCGAGSNQPCAAINAETGFIGNDSVSYWTSNSNYWSFDPRGLSATPASDSPDGPEVEKGGAAQVARTNFANNTFSTSSYSAGRNVYSCLGTKGSGGCLANPNSTAAEARLSNTANAFVSTNSVVKDLLTPAGSETVTLSAAYLDAAAMTGIEVTATAADGSHTYIVGDSVKIQGAFPAAFNGIHIVTAVTANSFKYQINVSPITPATGTIQASLATNPPLTVTSIAVSDYANDKALVTVANGYSNGDVVSVVTSPSVSYFNATGSIASVTGASFVMATNPYPKPTSPATTPGTSKVGTNTTATNTLLRRYGRTVVVTVSGSGSTTVDGSYGITVGSTVVVAGAAPSEYNGSFKVKALNSNCDGAAYANSAAGIGNGEKRMYCYYLIEDITGGATATLVSNPKNVALTRSGTTVTATTTDGLDHGLSGSVLISGALQSQYNGTYNISGSGTSFTYTLAALSPSDTTITGGPITASPPATTPVDVPSLIEWVRGVDANEDENANNSRTDVRTTIHADVLHSRPVAVSYGTIDESQNPPTAQPGVVVFYGTNDGMLHAVNGDQTRTAAGSAGRERWAFIPKEFLSYTKLSRLYSNEPIVKYPNTPLSIVPTPIKRDYFWDGSIGVLQTTDRSVTLLYASARRGGRMMYALNVSSVDDPRYLWSISNSDSGFEELGQTWSAPLPVKFRARDVGSGTTYLQNAVVFGAGYDPNENDKAPGVARTPKMGRGVFVVDAVSGQKLALAQPPGVINPGTATAGVFDFAADVVPVDINADGYVDRIYGVDTGANVWRFDVSQEFDSSGADTLGNAGPGVRWTAYKIATLGGTGVNDRKILYAPTVITFNDATLGRNVAQILVATGDREAPLDTTVRNRVYNIMDTIADDGTGSGSYPIVLGVTPLQDMTSAQPDTTTVSAWDRSTYPKGWFFEFDRENGEKAVNAPTLTGGVVFFATNSPTTINPDLGVCSNLGNARGYAVSPFTGLPAIDRDGDGVLEIGDYYTTFTGGGLPPTVTSGVVRIVVNGQDVYVPFAIGTGVSRSGGVEGLGGNGGDGTAVTTNTDSSSTIGGSINVDVNANRRNRGYWSFDADE